MCLSPFVVVKGPSHGSCHRATIKFSHQGVFPGVVHSRMAFHESMHGCSSLGCIRLRSSLPASNRPSMTGYKHAGKCRRRKPYTPVETRWVKKLGLPRLIVLLPRQDSAIHTRETHRKIHKETFKIRLVNQTRRPDRCLPLIALTWPCLPSAMLAACMQFNSLPFEKAANTKQVGYGKLLQILVCTRMPMRRNRLSRVELWLIVLDTNHVHYSSE